MGRGVDMGWGLLYTRCMRSCIVEWEEFSTGRGVSGGGPGVEGVAGEIITFEALSTTAADSAPSSPPDADETEVS